MRRNALLWVLTLSAVLLTHALDSSGGEVVLLHDGVQEDICGDGKKSGGEQCDDGNVLSNDGCNAACEVMPGYACVGGTEQQKDTCTPECGDGLKVGNEQCDDGNSSDNDGCSAQCEVETGFMCEGGSAEAADTCATVCGDGRQMGSEQCDDGNAISGDGCSAECGFEDGFECTEGTSEHKSSCEPVCGDREILSHEECDDGNKIDGDGCSSTCRIEIGFNCGAADAAADGGGGVRQLLQAEGICQPVCGDGRRVGNEQCDDNNAVDGDGCSTSCQVEPDKFCYGGTPSSSDQCFPLVCGDDKTGGAEGCDDGNLQPNDGCDDSCQVEDGWKCESSPTTRSKCEPVCGDSQIHGTEQCDDGNTTNGDGCDSQCKLQEGWQCPAGQDCSQIVCGDGMVSPSEACDDGNSVSGDGCSNSQADPPCGIELGWKCEGGTETSPTQCHTTCADGRKAGEEECDDGNTVDGDGCAGDCKIEAGYACTVGGEVSKQALYAAPAEAAAEEPAAAAEEPAAVADDGSQIRRLGEDPANDDSAPAAADDAAAADGAPAAAAAAADGAPVAAAAAADGAPAAAAAEDAPAAAAAEAVDLSLEGHVSTCAEQVCGDGKRFGTEECDDFNSVSGDGCSEDCKVEQGYECNGGSWLDKDICGPHCGDGLEIIGEACDDGNLVEGDGCSAQCLVEPGYECDAGDCSTICGDGRKIGAEECDDGNEENADGCTSTCKVEEGFICKTTDAGHDECLRKVNCETSEWNGYTPCTKECDTGEQKRTRVVVTSPSSGGTLCPALVEERKCNTQGCTPVDCAVSGWAQFSECSKLCGGGTRARNRVIDTKPLNGGGVCPALAEEESCNTGACAVQACKVSQWTEWTSCDKSCGGGEAKRAREITTEPGTGGAACPMVNESRDCNTQGCPAPVDCKVAEWGDYTECDVKCGGGKESRNRQVEIEAASGGVTCPVTIESRNCNTQGCPSS